MKNYNNEYTGEVFVGIDVHRSSYMVAEVISGEVVKKTSMPSSWQTFLIFGARLLLNDIRFHDMKRIKVILNLNSRFFTYS